MGLHVPRFSGVAFWKYPWISEHRSPNHRSGHVTAALAAGRPDEVLRLQNNETFYTNGGVVSNRGAAQPATCIEEWDEKRVAWEASSIGNQVAFSKTIRSTMSQSTFS